jgi:hypothetical protein
MNVKIPLILAAAALIAAAPISAGKKKKNEEQRALLEKMDAVPCGAQQKGLSGLGSFWASVGVTHIDSNEKLCPQYLLRTDDMDYRVRPTNLKHPDVLPIGHEVTFKIKKDRMYLNVPDSSIKSGAPYQVVSIEPTGAPAQDATNKGAQQ